MVFEGVLKIIYDKNTFIPVLILKTYLLTLKKSVLIYVQCRKIIMFQLINCIREIQKLAILRIVKTSGTWATSKDIWIVDCFVVMHTFVSNRIDLYL